MPALSIRLLAAVAVCALANTARAQTFPTTDPVIRQMWTEGMDRSQVYRLASVLLDSIGPRLTNTPEHQRAIDWLVKTYGGWGISARSEAYGAGRVWRRGRTHVDLLAPRFRTLEVTMQGWSAGTRRPIEADVILLPDVADSSAFAAWLPEAKGKFVLTSFAQPTCRPDESWIALARPATVTRMRAERDTARNAWNTRVNRAGRDLDNRLGAAGVAGIIKNQWSAGWGVNKIFTAATATVPSLHASCEDYGLLFRLAQNGWKPRIRVDADAEFLPDKPTFNVIAEIRGTEKPDEYVVLSAHLDSFDSAAGATDNGTGTLTMLEAMRILKTAYPNPKRTILVGHWGGEEQGLVGSNAFAEAHPEIVAGLQASFNQDNGTWRIEYIRMMGFAEAGTSFARWMSKIPNEISDNIRLDIPGVPETGGSDHMSWICRGAPGFRLQSHYPEYRQYTWHTDRDTFDKIVWDDLRNNATLTAMLVYMAAEDPVKVSRVKRELPPNPNGAPANWPGCPRLVGR